MNFPIVTEEKKIENNIIDITDKLLQVTPMRYKVTPWLIKRYIRAYVAWATMPLYFVNAVMDQNKDEQI